MLSGLDFTIDCSNTIFQRLGLWTSLASFATMDFFSGLISFHTTFSTALARHKRLVIMCEIFSKPIFLRRLVVCSPPSRNASRTGAEPRGLGRLSLLSGMTSSTFEPTAFSLPLLQAAWVTWRSIPEISIHGIDSQRDESRGMLLRKISLNAWCSLIRRSDVTPSREVRVVDWRKEDRPSLFVHGERD
nr:hypothetical protein Iba_chr04aCG17780 [Ipomoea batatas]